MDDSGRRHECRYVIIASQDVHAHGTYALRVQLSEACIRATLHLKHAHAIHVGLLIAPRAAFVFSQTLKEMLYSRSYICSVSMCSAAGNGYTPSNVPTRNRKVRPARIIVRATVTLPLFLHGRAYIVDQVFDSVFAKLCQLMGSSLQYGFILTDQQFLSWSSVFT